MALGDLLLVLVLCFSTGFELVYAINGQATWYNTGLGSCGLWNTNKDRVVALNPIEYAGGTRCGKFVILNYQGKTTHAKIVDLCPSCGFTGIDLSPAAFQALAPLNIGLLTIDWEYA